ncbi:MAG: protein phosphatase CheZ [Candidatus Kapabacteria bacterium]|jgi:chemotaxis regulatin CheY-phosphate phosphatase CheZ|nr:protein phosphatase CheZ [Candidatus Kapabacteria bacterium]
MIADDLNILLRKADELRSLFVLGQKVIPFLEEIFLFVSEIQPLLDEINSSIKDNLRRMPSASKQLSKVTEATELATNEILDLVDGILFNTDTLNANLDKISRISDLDAKQPIEILEMVCSAIENGEDLMMILPELKTVIEQLKTGISGERNRVVYNTREIIKTIKSDSSSIMISLQVQDITSQQIAAVNKLLETVQEKLEMILRHFKDYDFTDITGSDTPLDDDREIKVSKLHREIAFDPTAVDSLLNSNNRQQEVDELIKETQESIAKSESGSKNSTSDIEDNTLDTDDDFVTQDDIDKMFNK